MERMLRDGDYVPDGAGGLETAEGATVETSVDGNVVGLRQGKILATAFHPELTDDTRIHELFLSL